MNSIFTFTITVFSCAVFGSHAITLTGESPKYPLNFKYFDYAQPDASPSEEITVAMARKYNSLSYIDIKGDSPNSRLSELVYESLATSSLDEMDTVYGLLAEDIRLNPQTSSIEITLRKGISFSDGSTLNAKSVKYAFELYKNGEGIELWLQELSNDILSIEVQSDLKLRFNLKEYNRNLILDICKVPIVHKSIRIKYTKFPVGSGPYKISDFKPGKLLVFKKNQQYWGKDIPPRKGLFHFNKITSIYFGDAFTTKEAFLKKDLDILGKCSSATWSYLQKKNKERSEQMIFREFTLKTPISAVSLIYNFNNPALKDDSVRFALASAFIFNEINSKLFHRKNKRPKNVFLNAPYGQVEYGMDDSSSPRDIRKRLLLAQKALKESGWSLDRKTQTRYKIINGKKIFLEFSVLYASPVLDRVFALYNDKLKKLGIKLNYKTTEPIQIFTKRKNQDFDIHVMNIFIPFYSQYFINLLFHSTGFYNFGKINNKDLDFLLEEIMKENDPFSRHNLYDEVSKLIFENNLLLPMWYKDYTRFVHHDKFSCLENYPKFFHDTKILLFQTCK